MGYDEHPFTDLSNRCSAHDFPVFIVQIQREIEALAAVQIYHVAVKESDARKAKARAIFDLMCGYIDEDEAEVVMIDTMAQSVDIFEFEYDSPLKLIDLTAGVLTLEVDQGKEVYSVLKTTEIKQPSDVLVAMVVQDPKKFECPYCGSGPDFILYLEEIENSRPVFGVKNGKVQIQGAYSTENLDNGPGHFMCKYCGCEWDSDHFKLEFV